MSETWITTEKGMNFEMEGYEFIYNKRQSKGGGGVAIYVYLKLNFKMVEAMTQVVYSLLECLTIQICIEKNIKRYYYQLYIWGSRF